MRFSWLLVWLALAFAVGWPLLTSLESLWVDELHSAWVIDGPWNEVASRAAIGNQSSLYFGCLKLFRNVVSAITSTFEWSLPNELLLRLFSWLGWVAMIGFIAYRHRHRRSTILILSMWLWLDRIGSFYAIETRPYIWVAFLSLLLMNSAIPVSKTPHKIHWMWLLWAVLMFYSHYTSLIVIALSMCGIFIDISLSSPSCERFRLRSIIQSRVFEAFIFLGFAAPGLFYLARIGEGSQQWNSFAGDQSFRACFGLFPWFAWCFVPAVFLILERGWVGLSGNTDSLQPTRFKSWEKSQGWLIQASVIGFGGVVIVWSLTSLGVAPLMHRRYAIGAYPALMILGSLMLNQLSKRSALVGAAIVSSVILGGAQGTFHEWGEGRWLAWQRQEDWRLVVNYLTSKASPGEPVFVAPMLVETKGSQLSTKLPKEYLTAPLRTLYHVSADHELIPLPNDRDGWFDPMATVLNDLAGQQAWVIVRTSQVDQFAGSYFERSSGGASEKTIVLTPKLNAGRVQLFYAGLLNTN